MPSKYYSRFSFFLFILLFSVLPGSNLANNGSRNVNEHTHTLETGYTRNDAANEQTIISRFSKLVRVGETEISKYMRLYRFIDEWFGTPYKWAGCSKRGIDCSCFVQKLYNQVFNIQINRTSLMQFCKDVVLFTNRNQFQLGDLVFFKTPIRRETRHNRVTHVGFYLTNGYFVQASSSGVNIASLNSGYWKNYFVAAGRLKEVYYKKARAVMPTGEVDNNRVIEVEEGEEDGSVFDPVFYPEDKDSIITEYSRLLDVEKSQVEVPEVFEFVEKNRYAPYNISSKCAKTSKDNSCFISTFFKDVFYVDLENTSNEVFLANYTGRLNISKLKDTLLDIVRLQQVKKGVTEIITGIYLYNGYFLHLDKKDVAISSIEDPAFAGFTREYFRLRGKIGDKVFENLRELRKNGGVLPDSLRTPDDKNQQEPRQQKPVNILKNDTGSTAIPQVIPVMGPDPLPDSPEPQITPQTKKPVIHKKRKRKKSSGR